MLLAFIVTIFLASWVCAAVPAVLFVINLRVYREPEGKANDSRVAVLIPARNEERNVVACLRAVLASQDTDLEVLVRRVGRKDNRPLLRGKDPLEVLRSLAEVRYPFYAEADIVVDTGDAPHTVTGEAILDALRRRKEDQA